MALYDEFAPQPNRLIDARSAYLRSAAYQPVGWFEFSPEAFEEARQQHKPVLLDIGAMWCHWCHVIDRESYDDPEIATIINEQFIPVKVDRDERPDIDARYQLAAQLFSGQGGWPLTIFLTPDGEPFYAGTYFPPEDRGGLTGMKTLLPRLAASYRRHGDELVKVAHTLTRRIEAHQESAAQSGPVSLERYQRLADSVMRRFDPDHGGFERGGPKFPHPGAIELALLQRFYTGKSSWEFVVEKTLSAMAHGGIFDQLGGGFHRYATDATWTVPHFEKMGYENGLLLMNYIHAYHATGREQFRQVAEQTVDFIFHTLADHKHGGFFSSQDADNSLHDDGDYWTWTLEEFIRPLTEDEARVLVPLYGVHPRGSMPGTQRNVLHLASTPDEVARTQEFSLEEVHRRVASGRRKLLEARRARKTPAVDTNKYVNWNALLIAAMLEAGMLLGRDDALRFALRSMDHLVREAYDPDRGVYHAVHEEAGARLPGFFEDQAYMAYALLLAHGAGGKWEYLETARHLMDLAVERYWDPENGGFFDIERQLLVTGMTTLLRQPRKVVEDLPTPAANAIAAMALQGLWLLTREDRYQEYARRTLEAFAAQAPDYGPYAGYYGLALGHALAPPALAVIVGQADADDTRALLQAARTTYRPGKLVSLMPPDAHTGQYPPGEDGRAVAYCCAGQTCSAPIYDAAVLRETLATFGKPPWFDAQSEA